MAKRTKKVGPAGRFQARYGVRARSRLRNIELIQRKKHICPSCKHNTVKRVSTGIYSCKKCGIKFDVGLQVEKIIRGEKTSTGIINDEEEEVETK